MTDDEDRDQGPGDPNAHLWMAVVVQAFRDALMGDPPANWRHKWSTIACAGVANIPMLRDKARGWLLDGGRDMADVCLMAGFDPNAIRDAAKRILTNEAETRAARRIFFTAPVGAKGRTSTLVRFLLGTGQLRGRGNRPRR